MDGKPARGLRWGELFLGLGFVLANVGTAFIPGVDDAQFYVRYWLAWMSFAAFVGLSAVLILVMRNSRVLWHVAVAVVILTGIALSLRDQHFFASSGVRNWLFNLAAIAGLVACVRANRRLPDYARVFAVPVTVLVLCETLFWVFLSPSQIFLPILFYSEAGLAAAHVVFVQAFLSGVLASVLAFATTAFCLSRRVRSQSRAPFLESPVSRKAGLSMILGFAAVGVLFYFVPGIASGSGLVGVEYLGGTNKASEHRVPVDEVSRYLREKGFQPSESTKSGFRPFRQGEPLAWFRYPLSGSHDLELCLLRDRDRDGSLYLYFRYAGASIFKAQRAQSLMETVRKHFWEAWLTSHHPASR